MTKKRDRLEIIHDILRTIRDKGNEVKPTHILYKSNLSHQMMTAYLDELIEKRFVIEKIDKKKKKKYSLTETGFSYLNDYHKIKSFVDSYGLE
jgi:predicted transcriptional regulator